MGFGQLIKDLNIPSEILDCATGTVRVPEFTINAPFDPSFGFPPAIIPIWSNSSWPGYIGVLKHWFGQDNSYCYCQYYAETNQFFEIARNFEQFRAFMVYDFLRNVPDFDEVGEFAEDIGLCKSFQVEKYFTGCRVLEDLLSLDVFHHDPPSLLVDGEKPQEWAVSYSIEKFEAAIVEGRWDDLWFLTNSPGWTVAGTKRALGVLRGHARDALFNELVECWNSVHL